MLIKDVNTPLYHLRVYDVGEYTLKYYTFDDGGEDFVINKKSIYSPSILFTRETQIISLEDIPPFEIQTLDRVVRKIKKVEGVIEKIKNIIENKECE